jgi:hypothetical protein
MHQPDRVRPAARETFDRTGFIVGDKKRCSGKSRIAPSRRAQTARRSRTESANRARRHNASAIRRSVFGRATDRKRCNAIYGSAKVSGRAFKFVGETFPFCGRGEHFVSQEIDAG